MSRRDQIAEALHEQLGSVVELDVCESAADALLPLVDRLCAEAIAEALELLADDLASRGPNAQIREHALRNHYIPDARAVTSSEPQQ